MVSVKICRVTCWFIVPSSLALLFLFYRHPDILCGIDHQPGSQPAVRQEAADGVDAGAHLLFQTRTKVLNNDLEEVLRRWYPISN